MVVSEPLGVVLVVGAWCSPVHLCLGPLVGAIAAGKYPTVHHSGLLVNTSMLVLD